MKKVLIARIGYMDFYQGCINERPINGGAYNKNAVGHECFNFKKEIDGRCYGYVRPPAGLNKNHWPKLNIKRIDPNLSQDDGKCVNDVLVIWVATRPKVYGGGQVVVGWYSGATVFRESREFPANIDRSLLKKSRYNIVCDSKNAHLLPLGKRRLEIPKTGTGKKSLGNANVFYLLDESYNVKKNIAPEINKAVKFTEQYKGNFVDSEKDCTQEQIAMVAYEFNPKIRKAIEDYAVKKCMDEYRKRKFHCENVSLKESYDILATKGRKQVKIEVKGTRSAGDSVILTKNEYKLVKKSETRLFLVHSIRMNKDGKMSGGVIVDCKWGDLNLKFEPFYLCKIEEK